MFKYINLQMFADGGGALVNATNGYVNAYTGNVTQFSGSASLNPTMKTFYDTQLLENYRRKAIYGQFAKKVPLPAGNGKTIEFRKWNTFQRASQLQEAVIPTGQAFGMTSKTGSVAQYGTYTAVSDVLELQAYDDVISGATEEMGASAGDTQEQLLVDAFLTNTNEYWCENVDASGQPVGTRPAANNAMGWSTTNGFCKLTGAEVNRIVTVMKSRKVPTINGKYIFVVHPKVAFELRKDPEWLDAHKYAATREIFNGEIGVLHGAIFLENPDSPVYGDTYKNKEGGVVYASYVFGKEAFGHINPEGGNLQMIIKTKEQAGGPLSLAA